MRKRRKPAHAPDERDAMWMTAPAPKPRDAAPAESVARPEPGTYEDTWYRVLRGGDPTEPDTAGES